MKRETLQINYIVLNQNNSPNVWKLRIKFVSLQQKNNRASEYRVGLQIRREGFRGPVFFVEQDTFRFIPDFFSALPNRWLNFHRNFDLIR